MNIERAKCISIFDLLTKAGFTPTKSNGHDIWYLSPRRDEKTASFHIHAGKNVWYDHGDGIGGNSLDLAIEILKSRKMPHSVSDTLKWLETMPGLQPMTGEAKKKEHICDEKKLVITKVTYIQHPALITYLESRGIALSVAKRNTKQLKVYNRELKKHFFALGFKNEDGGYELRNKFFKGSISPKAITFIRGSIPQNGGIHLFEGSMDYNTVVMINNNTPLKDDAIILNSNALIKEAFPYITGYGYEVAYTWMDNDTSGKKATKTLHEFFKTEPNLKHKPMNSVYAPQKDVNAWHMHNLNLTPAE